MKVEAIMKQKNHQSGFALITGLLILLMLTLILLTALKTAVLEELMAGNLRNHNIAFQAAESALREAELMIEFQTDLDNELSWSEWKLGGGEAVNPFSPLWLAGGPFQSASTPACVDGVCSTTSPLQSTGFATLKSGLRTASTGIKKIQEPEYIIELIDWEYAPGDTEHVHGIYRITVRAWGEDPNSLVQLQSTYRGSVVQYVL